VVVIAEGFPEINGGVRLKSVALPVEHGGWSLLFEPIVLGLLVAPSLAGLLVSLFATAAFLARHPFKLAMTDWYRQRVSRRTTLALRVSIAYTFIAILSLSLAIVIGGVDFLLPLVVAAPIVITQLWYDSVGRSRALIAELAGSIATGSVATVIALCGGWPRSLAFALWIVVAARSVPTILYLRAKLRLLRQKPASSGTPIIAHMIAVVVIIVLAWKELAPWLGVLAMGVLLFRAFAGLRSTSRITAQRLGVGELLFGVFTILAVAGGYRYGW
jgi:hypothetical protein